MSAATVSPVEFVKGLSLEQKEEVFYAILEEVLAEDLGAGFIGLGKGDGPDVAYLISAPELHALCEQYHLPIGIDVTDEVARGIPREERDWLTTAEMLDELDAEDDEPVPEEQFPSAGSHTAVER